MISYSFYRFLTPVPFFVQCFPMLACHILLTPTLPVVSDVIYEWPLIKELNLYRKLSGGKQFSIHIALCLHIAIVNVLYVCPPESIFQYE